MNQSTNQPRLQSSTEPSLHGGITKIEKVQNRFTKLLPHGHAMSHEERNKALGITSHQTRRLRGDLIYIYMYKLFEEEELFKKAIENRTRGNSKKLYLERTNNNLRKHSFSVRNISVWNNLNNDIVNAENLNTFK